MSSTQSSQINLEMLRHIAQSIKSVGVAGNDGDRHFDARSALASLEALRAQLREAGSGANALAVETLVQPQDDMDTLIYDTGRYGSQGDAEQALALDYRRRQHDRIERRADDWIERLRRLRSQMAAWLQTPEFSALSIVDLPPVTLFEEQMHRFGVPPREMPAFEIRLGTQRVMRFLPKGLWIIGANGRVDLFTKAAAPILVDKSEPLSGPSNWELFDSRGPGRAVPLTQDTFSDLIRNGL